MVAEQLETGQTDFTEHGVVFLPNLLSSGWIDLLAAGVRRNLESPGPYRRTLFPGTPSEFREDRCNYFVNPEYQIFLNESPLASEVAKVLDANVLWLYFEQLFVKEGGLSNATPWHQDSVGFCGHGAQFASVWVNLDPVPREASLQMVIGSHTRGPRYALTADDLGEQIPDVGANPDNYSIAAFEIAPGDVVMFHPSVLHGAPAAQNEQRRTLSFRFFGEDVTFQPPTTGRMVPPLPGLLDSGLAVGDPLRHSWFPRVFPTTNSDHQSRPRQ